MQSRNNDPGVSCCTVETVASDSDLVDITSVSIHRQMYDHCAANCFSDEQSEDYVYDDDDDDERLFAGGDNNVSHQALLTSIVHADVSDIPSANGIVDVQSSSHVDKPSPPPPFGFPPRSLSEIMSPAVELLDTNMKHESEDAGGNNNSMPHHNAECFKQTASSLCHTGDSNSTVQTAESAETSGKVFCSVLPLCSLHSMFVHSFVSSGVARLLAVYATCLQPPPALRPRTGPMCRPSNLGLYCI